MSDAILRRIDEQQGAILAALHQIVSALDAQTQMLSALMEMVQPPEGESDLVEALRRLATAVEANGETLQRVEQAMVRGSSGPG